MKRLAFLLLVGWLMFPLAVQADPPETPVLQPAPAPNRTLYERLGAEHGLWLLASDFFDRIQRDGDMRGLFIGVDMDQLKHHVVDYLGHATGGPQVYQGRDMHAAHARMKLSPEDWDHTMVDLHETLDKLQVGDQEQKELIGIVSGLRGQIVQSEPHDFARGGDPGQF